MVPVPRGSSAEDLAGALLSHLTGSSAVLETDALWEYVRKSTHSQVPECVLECLALLSAQTADAHAASNAAMALVTLSRVSPRSWSMLVSSGIMRHVSVVRRCVEDTLFEVQSDLRCGLDVRESLLLLSANPLAEKVCGTGRARTPVDVAVSSVVAEVREFRAQPESARRIEEYEGRACAKVCAAFESLPESGWRYVCDDDFAEVVSMLRSSNACKRAGAILDSASFLSRLRGGFERGTPAAGRLYAALTSGDADTCPLAYEVVAGWPESIGTASGFRLGYLSWGAGVNRDDTQRLRDIREVEQIAAYAGPGLITARELEVIGDEKGWFNFVPTESGSAEPDRRKLLAAAFMIAPAYFGGRLAAVEHVLQEAILDVPLSVTSAIDKEVDHLLRALLTEVPEVRDDLRALGSKDCDTSFLSQSGHADAENRINAASLRLHRIALTQTLLLMRKVMTLCAATQTVLRVQNSCHPRNIAIATGIIRAVAALQSRRPIDSRFDSAVRQCAQLCVTTALGESRAANGVRDGFAALATASCGLLGNVHGRVLGKVGEERVSFRSDKAFIELLRSAEQSQRTDHALRMVLEKVLNSRQ